MTVFSKLTILAHSNGEIDNRSPEPDTPKWRVQKKREIGIYDSEDSNDSDAAREMAKKKLKF